MIDWDDTDTAVATALRARGIESDLGDADLNGYAQAARQEIAARLGAATGIVRRNDGGQRFIFLSPPIATLTSVSENGEALTVDVDFRIGGAGAHIERSDEEGFPRAFGPWVIVTYDGAAQDDRYDRVVVDLVKLALEYSGLDSRRDGDYTEESKGARGGGAQHNYQLEREALIGELVPATVPFA